MGWVRVGESRTKQLMEETCEMFFWPRESRSLNSTFLPVLLLLNPFVHRSWLRRCKQASDQARKRWTGRLDDTGCLVEQRYRSEALDAMLLPKRVVIL